MKYLLVYYLTNTFANISASEVNIPRADPDGILSGILNLTYMLTGAAAVIALIISGWMYVMSNGNAQTVEKAKNGILYSIIGIIVVASAFTITQFVIGRF